METEKSYLIGGLKIHVTGGETVHAISRLTGFSVFETNDPRDADIIIETDQPVDVATPEGMTPLREYTILEIKQRFSSFDGCYLFEMRKPDGSLAVAMTHDPRTNRVIMSKSECDISLRFAMWVAYSFVAVVKGVIPIHASSVVRDGETVLFLGESGTGKSTHSRLWIEHIVGTYLLNDDSPLVRVTDGQIVACGSPWSGKVPCYRREELPVKAIVRLRQGQENKLKQVTRLGAIGALYPSCPPLFAYDNQLSGFMLQSVDKIVKAVPIYIMECLPNKEAVEIVYSAIYG